MPIAVLCPACGARINAPDGAAGRQGKCPKCKAALIIPGRASPSAVRGVAPATYRTPAQPMPPPLPQSPFSPRACSGAM
jgi:hypothetical protein